MSTTPRTDAEVARLTADHVVAANFWNEAFDNGVLDMADKCREIETELAFAEGMAQAQRIGREEAEKELTHARALLRDLLDSGPSKTGYGMEWELACREAEQVAMSSDEREANASGHRQVPAKGNHE